MLYEYICSNGHEFERSLPVAEYRTPQFCECGRKGKRVISAPMLAVVQRECRYDSPIDGRPITSWAQRKEDLARNGCQEYDPGMKQDYHRRIEREDRDIDKKLDATVEAEIEKMPARKREKLMSELDSGATAVPERRSVPISTTRTVNG
jgi:hypothetical protein